MKYRTRTITMLEPTYNRSVTEMPETIIPAVANLATDHFTGLMQTIPYWVKGLFGLFMTAFGWFQKALWSGIKENRDKIDQINTRCGLTHQGVATRDDLHNIKTELKEDMRNGFDGIKDYIDIAIRK